MSQKGKISLLLSFLALVVLVIARALLGGWVNFLYGPLIIFVLGLALSLAFDFRFFKDFLSMRTTKHGMNMGAMILLTFGLLFCLNYFGVRYNKTFDFTEEKINSLSEQTNKILDGLNEDVQVLVFYTEGDQSAQIRAQLRQNFSLFQERSSKIKLQMINSYVDVTKADDYLKGLTGVDQEQVFVFLNHNGRRVRVEAPFMEQQVTSALVKITRENQKKIYFITGHGERDLNSELPEGLKTFRQSLEDSSYVISTWNLAENTSLPPDADIVAIVGPERPYLDAELDMLRTYARGGGHLLLALDPGQRHNLALLTKSLGVEFQNNYIIDQLNQLLGRGAASALGLIYDKESDVTKAFRDGDMSVFDLASELRAAPESGENLVLRELVKTNTTSFSMSQLQQATDRGERGSRTIAISVRGQMKPAPGAKIEEGTEAPKEFSALVVGDSDFLSNKAIFQGLNRDFALNSIGDLAKESDLISIRPKQLKGTSMIMTSTHSVIVVLAGLSLPLIFILMGGTLWFRRRSA